MSYSHLVLNGNAGNFFALLFRPSAHSSSLTSRGSNQGSASPRRVLAHLSPALHILRARLRQPSTQPIDKSKWDPLDE